MRGSKTRADHRLSRWQANWRRSRLPVLLTVFILVSAGSTSADVDPFYSNALTRGAAAYESGSFETAERDLRIACFGMLDDPEALADALVRLALTQAALGDRTSFLETVDRIERIEQLFGAYSVAVVPPALRSLFEDRVLEWVSSTVLEDSPTFGQLYMKRELDRISLLPARDRVAALQPMVNQHPEQEHWRLLLATARVESGDGRGAIADLETIVASQPNQRHATCLLGRALLQIPQCDGTYDRVRQCDLLKLPNSELTQYVDCLADAQRWSEAFSIVASLPPEARGSRAMRKREKLISRNLESEARAETGNNLPPVSIEGPTSATARELPTSPPPRKKTTEPAPEPTAIPQQRTQPTEPARETPANGSPEIETAPTRSAEEEWTALRLRLDEATSVIELEHIMAEAEGLLVRYPEAREPLYIAGEAAYRASDWRRAADYLRSGGGPPGERPELLFYWSVSLFELGKRKKAASILRRALPSLKRTALVQVYVTAILEGDS